MEGEFGAKERELLESSAAALYESAVQDGRIEPGDPRVAKRSPDRPAFDLLTDLGLVVLDPEQNVYRPVDPSAVQARVVAPMGQQAAHLLEESSRWSQVFSGLGQSYRRSGARHPVTEIRGVANINRYLSAAVEEAQSELLTAQPTSDRSMAALAVAVQRDIRAVQRGVNMSTLYQHSARRSVAIKEYVDQMSPYGAQVRTLEEFFNRMIVVDRAVAIVPGKEVNQVAIAIHEPALVAYLVDIFERYWERARPFDDRAESTTRNIAEDVRNMTLRMLVEGHSDPASAKRVGVSTRTYAGYISSLKDEYGVQTRFQLGYAMGQQERDDGRG
ncbi:MAG: LuxR family transcriptional regulator [Marmoricola sp.]